MEKMKKALKVGYKYSPFALIILAIIFIVFHQSITSVFPYLFASIFLVLGVLGIVFGGLKLLAEKHKFITLAFSVIFIILGIILFVKAKDVETLLIIGVTWSIVSFVKGALQLSFGIEQALKKMKRSLFNFFKRCSASF